MSFTSLSQSYVDGHKFFSDAHWTWSVENFLMHVGGCEVICEVMYNDMCDIGRLNELIH